MRFDHHLVPGLERQALAAALLYPRLSRTRPAYRQHVGENLRSVRQYDRRYQSGVVVDPLHVRGI